MTSIPSKTNQWIRAEIAGGTFEGVEQEWCRELPEGKTALELGAGIGLVSRVLADRFERVVSVEANVTLEPHWKANVHAEGRWNAELRHGLVRAQATDIFGTFRISDEEWWKSTASDAPITGESELRAVQLAILDFAWLLDDVKPEAVLMDIEGAEWGVLHNLPPAALASVHDLIVELHPGLWPDARREAWPLQRSQIDLVMQDAGLASVREYVAPGWPVGTPHPLGISHVWWKRAL